jgi:membrane-associated phospholipid phosphatase
VGPMKLSSADGGAVVYSTLYIGGEAPVSTRTLWLAQVISIACLPPLLAIGTMVVLSSYLIADPYEAARVALISSFFTSIAPALYISYLLKRNKIGGGMHLALREERLRPYLVGAGSCLVGLLFLAHFSAPQQVIWLTLCYAVNSLVMAMITLRWKISAHAAGAAMPFTALLTVFGTAALPLGIIIPVVCWARVRSKMHTVAQTCAGALLGFALTWLQLSVLSSRF